MPSRLPAPRPNPESHDLPPRSEHPRGSATGRSEERIKFGSVNAEASSDPRPDHAADWYVDHLLTDAQRITRVIEQGDLTAPIAACPGWDVRQLVVHLGVIHRWARHCVLHAAPPDGVDAFQPGDRDLKEWFEEGVQAVADTLRALDPDTPTWHPFTVDRVAGVWPRRQANETAMHRWDAQRAVGEPDPIDPELASDGIDEYFELAIPRLIKRERVTAPTSSFHVHCTDVDGEWLVWNEDGAYRMERAHAKGDAALRGPAEAILLRLWGRSSARAAELSPVGDEEVLDAWLAFAGM